MRAKTGTLDGVSSLAGRATAKDGSSVEFAVAFNGLRSTAQGVAASDAMSEAFVGFPDAVPLASVAPEGFVARRPHRSSGVRRHLRSGLGRDAG